MVAAASFLGMSCVCTLLSPPFPLCHPFPTLGHVCGGTRCRSLCLATYGLPLPKCTVQRTLARVSNPWAQGAMWPRKSASHCVPQPWWPSPQKLGLVPLCPSLTVTCPVLWAVSQPVTGTPIPTGPRPQTAFRGAAGKSLEVCLGSCLASGRRRFSESDSKVYWEESVFSASESRLSLRTIGSDFKVEIFTKKLLALDSFGPWDDFLSLCHCLVKRAIE
jgi:hypothetical protein